MPTGAQNIFISVWDDDVGLDNIVGTINPLKFNEIKSKPALHQWYHIYGGPIMGRFGEGDKITHSQEGGPRIGEPVYPSDILQPETPNPSPNPHPSPNPNPNPTPYTYP